MLPGDVYDRIFSTSGGDIGVPAEVDVEGTALVLDDLAIYPTGAATLGVGARTIVALRDQLARDIASLGYTALRLIGTHATGASPGKVVNLTIELGGYR
jgi:hypothetical protein